MSSGLSKGVSFSLPYAMKLFNTINTIDIEQLPVILRAISWLLDTRFPVYMFAL